MKQFSVAFLLMAFVLGFVAVPGSAYAKNGNDDIKIELRGGWDHDDDEEDDDRHSSNKDLEVEANVYTDTTIVKVELENDGRKTVFTTTADTEAEVIDVVAAKFGLTEAEVEVALDFEIEDRASRTNERAKLSWKNNRPVKTVETCYDTTTSTLEVEADVFTNTTIVKVELTNGTNKVFETTATTSDDIAVAVAAKVTTLTVAEVKAVLDIDIENRASKASDFNISSSNNDDNCEEDDDNNDNNQTKIDARLEARIAELQKLVEALIKLLNTRLGN